jgi:hypothetical protein
MNDILVAVIVVAVWVILQVVVLPKLGVST